MLFPTHLVAGYALGRLADRSVPWVVAGAALPDLVDKPLAAAGLTELYHTIGHSALGLAALVAVALSLRRAELWAIAAGVASHLALDAGHVVLNGRPADAAFLGWPAVLPPDPLALDPIAFAELYLGTPSFVVECLVWVGVAVLVGHRLWARRETL